MDIDVLINFWRGTRSPYHENLKSLVTYLSIRCNYLKAIKVAMHFDLAFRQDFVQQVDEVEDADVQFLLYKYYTKGGQESMAERHLIKAQLFGHPEAIKIVQDSYRPIIEDFKKMVKNNANLMRAIFDSNYDWTQGVNIEMFFTAMWQEGIEVWTLDKDLVDVYFRCCCILKKAGTRQEKLEEAQQAFGITTHINCFPSSRRGKRVVFFLSLLVQYAKDPCANRLLNITRNDNYLSRLIYNSKDVRFTTWSYIDSESFHRDFPQKVIKGFSNAFKACYYDYMNLGDKRLEKLFNLYFMNTDILEIH